MLRKFENIHEGEVGLIIGNGPSLAECPRELLEKYITFGANGIYKMDGFMPNYLTVIDEHMVHNVGPALQEIQLGEGPKPDAMFIRRPYPITGCYHINCIVHAGWSLNINKSVVMGGTVTYANLQIAFYMGIRTAILVGVDHDYPSMVGAPGGAIFQMEGKDIDHFTDDYFEDGRFYAAPELAGSEAAYVMARMVYEDNGGRIINLTPGTKEEALEKGEYAEWL